VRKQLISLGYEVHGVTNGQDAFEYFKKNSNDIDLVILDVIMPILNGKETLKRILEISPETKILISSGFCNNNWHKEMIEMGALGFIQKPYRLNYLSYQVAKAMGKIQ